VKVNLIFRTAFILVATLTSLFAQSTLTWTGGGGTGNWSDPNNWGGAGIPDATNNILIFSGSTQTSTVDDIVGLTVQQIQTASGSASFTISGNDFTLGSATGPSNTISVNSNLAPLVINNNISLGVTQTWSPGTSGLFSPLNINGNISLGGFNLTTNSSGSTFAVALFGTMSGTGTYTALQGGPTDFIGNNTSTGVTTASSIATLDIGNAISGNLVTSGASTLIVDGAIVNGSVDINSAQAQAFRLLHGFTVGGNATVTGTEMQWYLNSLTDDSSGTPGTDWGSLSLNGGGNLTFASASRLQFVFPSDPNSGNPFWNSSHQWLLGDLTTGTLDYSGLGIELPNWTTGDFSLTNIGNDLYLDFTAVPEPSTIALFIGGLALLGFVARRQRA